VTRSRLLALGAATLIGAAFALVGGDALGLARLGPALDRAALGALASAGLAAGQANVLHRALGATLPWPRRTAIAALAAATITFVLATAKTPWIALGPFGAGPLGELALIVVPLSQLLAVLATTSVGVTRGASRTPPSSRPPSPRPRSTS
jgi:hypothetical protein